MPTVDLSLEAIKRRKFDHTKPVDEMTGEEIVAEYLFLKSGFADKKEDHGVPIYLEPDLQARREDLEALIVRTLSGLRKSMLAEAVM